MNGEPQCIVGEVTVGKITGNYYILLSVDREKIFVYDITKQKNIVTQSEKSYKERWSLL